jgi:tetratricopeptide (TPR) repeat protein
MACGDRLVSGRALGTLAEIAVDQQNLVEARRTYEELLAVSRESGDKSAHAWGLTRLGHVLQRLGNVSSAKKRLQEALTTFPRARRQLGIHGRVVGDRGNPSAAGRPRIRAQDV